MSIRVGVVGVASLLVLTTFAVAADWPQWMGPGRDDHWAETGILEKFPEGGAKILWRTPIAGGYAGPAVVGQRVFVTDFVRASGDSKNDPGGRAQAKGSERVLCLDAATGKEIWKHEYPCTYNISYPAGPRCTPTVSGGKVYCLGAEGNLVCLDAASGKPVWQKDLKQTYKIETPFWGFCGHPLVDGPRLICLVGGEGSVAVAFDKDTGKELWKALSAGGEPGYCPPTMIEAGGQRQLLIWHPKSLNSLNPATGAVYWSEPLVPQYGMSVAAPVKSGDFLYASSIGSVGVLFKLDKSKPAVEVVWEGKPNTAVFCSNRTPIIDGGTI